MDTKKTLKTKSLTKLGAEKKDKVDFHEKLEEIYETGHDNRRRGAKAITEVEVSKQKKDADLFNTQVELAEKKRRLDDKAYLIAIREACVEGIDQIDHRDYPGWKIKLFVTNGEMIAINKKPFKTQTGLLAIVISPKKEYYEKGMRASFDPLIDVNGARALAVSIEDTLDYYAGYMESSPQRKQANKIWTPKPSLSKVSKPSLS